MAPRRTRNRLATAVACPHCGRVGHSSNLCPRDDYSPDLPALTCSQCVRTVTTATGGDTTNEIYVGIQPCVQHSTLTTQPPSSAPSSLSTALAAAVPPTPPAPVPAANPAPTADPVAAAPAPQPIPPQQQPAPTQPLLPTRRNRTYNFSDIDAKYRQVVSLVNGGATSDDALEVAGIKRRTFRRWRAVAEARLLDEAGFLSLVNRISNATLQDCESQSKTILQRAVSRQKLEDLFRAGACLKPLRK